jgi:hypothetical protein
MPEGRQAHETKVTMKLNLKIRRIRRSGPAYCPDTALCGLKVPHVANGNTAGFVAIEKKTGDDVELRPVGFDELGEVVRTGFPIRR